MKFTQIDINKIDMSDKRFQICPFYSSDSLISSIKKAGLLNPPVLTAREGRNIIVSGWRRVSACQKLEMSFIPVFMMQEQSDLEAFKIPVYDNLSIRDYSHIEKAAVISKLYRFGETLENIIKNYMTLLKIPPRRDVMDIYLNIDQLKENLKEIAHQKRWPLGPLEMLTELPEKDIRAFYPFLRELSLNKQKQLIENIFEISRKKDISVQDLLSSEEFLRIQKDRNLDSIQKAEGVTKLAREQRFPSLNDWKKAFEKLTENLDLPEEITVIPSKFFEDDIISIKLDIRNAEELKKYIDKLRKLSTKKEISLLFNPFIHD